MGRTSGGGAGAAPISSYISSPVALTMSTPANVTHVTLGAGSWLVFGTVTSTSAAGTNCVECWLGPTSASASGAYVGGDGAYIDAARASTTTLVVDLSLSVSTTVYLIACALDAAASVSNVSYSVGGAPKASGILALQL